VSANDSERGSHKEHGEKGEQLAIDEGKGKREKGKGKRVTREKGRGKREKGLLFCLELRLRTITP
jgi:hypothetical protein